MEVGDGTVFRLPLPFTIPLHGGFFERLESSNRNLEHYSAFHAALSTASCIYLTSALHSSIVSSTNCVSEWNPTTRFTIPLPRSAPTVKYPRGLFLSPILSSILLSPFSASSQRPLSRWCRQHCSQHCHQCREPWRRRRRPWRREWRRSWHPWHHWRRGRHYRQHRLHYRQQRRR